MTAVGIQSKDEKGAASGYMGLDASSRGSQTPKVHGSLHGSGGDDPIPGLTLAAGVARFGINAGAADTTNQIAAFGDGALAAEASGIRNTAFGYRAMNVANGASTNSAFGYTALAAVTTAQGNSGFGNRALNVLTTGHDNVAVGDRALEKCTTGFYNTGVGSFALNLLTTGSNNTAVGDEVLNSVTTGQFNNGLGTPALYLLTTGLRNNAVGCDAGYRPNGVLANATTTGSDNCFFGNASGQASATQRSKAIAIGTNTLIDADGAIAIGYGATATAAGAIAIGYDSAGTSATSSTTNLAVIGTSLTTLQVQKLKVPGLGAFAASDKYVVVDSSGNFHISALGPAS